MMNQCKMYNVQCTSKNNGFIPHRCGAGFTLIEMLVVISLLSVVGVMILTIFSRTLKGTNKSQIISLLKQNGQSVLENMDKTIRNSNSVFCYNSSIIVVVNSNNTYTRYKFIPPGTTPPTNGYVQQQVIPPVNPPIPAYCDVEPSDTPVILTDNNSQTGVSVESGAFSNNHSPGFADQVTISFKIKPAVGAPVSITGQIDPATFQTTVELRNTN